MRLLSLRSAFFCAVLVVGAFVGARSLPAQATTPQPPPTCLADSSYHLLDFWLGRWSVTDSTKAVVGHNVIERIVGGCAITETWTEKDSEGRSLFYFLPSARQWKQIWVTPNALSPGGLKEKHFVGKTPEGGVRFQGEYFGPRGGLVLDRTTLTPLAERRVRQLIEISRDGGQTWRATFDAIYIPDAASR